MKIGRTLAAVTIAANLQATSAAAVEPMPGPVEGTKVTESWVRMVARDVYFWAWPMANVFNRRSAFRSLRETGRMGGIVPVAPVNRLSMLSDYIDPAERVVACPNQDVVYGAGALALDLDPIVVQVPDFGERFWVYQAVDVRTDGFAELGKMYGTKPGFYLLVGPSWKGDVPEGITAVFRSPTDTGFFLPRVFREDTPEDLEAVQQVINGIDMYPLREFDGTMKERDWRSLPDLPEPPWAGGQGGGESRWVVPEKFFDELPALLRDARPLPGEDALYGQVLFLAAVARARPDLRRAMIDEAKKADAEVVDPLLQFQSWGLELPHHWSTIRNGAAFGTDYFTRTAVARSNIFVNREKETKYFYQDLDESGARLTGANAYSVRFEKGQVPPVRGFWSLTLYDENHFFAPNAIGRYSVGTKSKALQYGEDGSLTIWVQPESPGKDRESNWLPSPAGAPFSLYVRAYWPEPAILDGSWTPPPVRKAGGELASSRTSRVDARPEHARGIERGGPFPLMAR